MGIQGIEVSLRMFKAESPFRILESKLESGEGIEVLGGMVSGF